MFRRSILQSGAAIAIVVAIAAGWSLLVESAAESGGALESGLVRFHVLANSDSPEDQRLKLLVRDAVVEYLRPQLENLPDKEAVRQRIMARQPELVRIAAETLLRQGVCYPVHVEYGVFDFPVKKYGELIVPAGKYEAVRILLGDAGGANWWCVLFPPLCFVDESTVVQEGADADVRHKMEDTKKEIEFRWKIAEAIKNLS